MRLTGHTHDRESPIQNFSTAPKKLGAHISRVARSTPPLVVIERRSKIVEQFSVQYYDFERAHLSATSIGFFMN